MHPKTAEAGCPAPPRQGIFHGLRVPDAGMDVVQCVIRWPGLDVAACRAAWERAVARHPVLRAGFAGDAEPGTTVDFTVRTDAVTDFLAEDQVRGLTSDAPVRVTVLTHATPTVVITVSGAVLDDRSLAMLLTELDSTHEDRPVHDTAGGHAVEQDRVSWPEHLAGVAATPLPFGTVAGAAGQASQTAEVTMTGEETVALRQLADTESVTLDTVVCAAWALVLGTHADTDDVVFGATPNGSESGAEGMPAATIPLRVGLDRSLSVGEWLREIHRDAVAVHDRRWHPGAQNLLSSLVLFERQDLHTLLREQNPAWDEREVELHRWPGHPLTVHVTAAPTLHLTLCHTRFTAAEANVLAGHLRVALLRLADSPHRKVGELSLLSPEEHTLLASGGHADPLAYPRERTIPDLFDEQVRRAPDADAVFDGEKWLSYAELDERATRIAAALRERGVGVEEPVAVALPRGVDLVAAFLGVLKSGAAYLPVDAAHPPARNAVVLADSGVRVVIADGGDWPADVLAVDDLPAATPFPCPARADTLAYLVYTSGSTGRPKGVAVPHRGVVRLVHEPNFATVGPGQTFLFAASPSFDATTFELWAALLTGARVVPAPPGPLDAADLAKLIDRHGVTLLWLTAGLFHQFAEHDRTVLSEVDQLLAGGDVLAPDAVRAALAARGGKPVTNGYGPTENTTFTTCHVMRDATDVGATTPIGRPVQHTTVYVLDDELRPVPVGAVGELYSGGDGVARGYLHRPALTAAKFVPDPFGPPGARLYRTGDRARWRADGTLEFLGRVDNQVKVRGFLVEPGEAEAVLRRHPQVADAAVVVHGADDLRRLVAYVAPEEVDLASVRAHVAAALPEFLQPSSYQVLPRFPLNASGKIDRAALPEPVAATGSVRLPLTGDAQHRMAGIWRALLGVDEVGAGDEFFELGGNSLLAMRLTFRIRETFGVELPIREIYRASTLADLTDAVTSAKKSVTAGIVRRERRAYRASGDVPAHLVAAESAATPDRHWALRRRVELRGSGTTGAGFTGQARITDSVDGLALRPEPPTVYLENRALSTPDTLPSATPRRLPLQPPGALSVAEATVLGAVDGVRTAKDIAEALSGPGGGPEVLRVLHTLRDDGRIAWETEVPPSAAEPALRARFERTGDVRVRDRVPSALGELERGRGPVAGTGAALVHEEWRPELDLGPELVASLMAPLSLLLESARWFTAAGAALHRHAVRDRLDARLTAALQERWADVLQLDMARSRVSLSATSLRDKVSAAFAVSRPERAGQHRADLTLAARDVDSVRRGEFQWVLGTLHAAGDTPFEPLPAAAHTPRVTIDKLVVSPETWRVPTNELAFAADDATRFPRVQEWRHATGVPRFVIVQAATEPFHVDLDSPPSVEQFAHAVRTLDQEEPGGWVRVSERLPGPDELWLADATGARYTAEFRFVAVDRRGLAPEGQS